MFNSRKKQYRNNSSVVKMYQKLRDAKRSIEQNIKNAKETLLSRFDSVYDNHSEEYKAELKAHKEKLSAAFKTLAKNNAVLKIKTLALNAYTATLNRRELKKIKRYA